MEWTYTWPRKLLDDSPHEHWNGKVRRGDGQLYLRIGRGERREVCNCSPAETNDSRVESHISGMAGRAGLDMASQLPYNLAQFTL